MAFDERLTEATLEEFNDITGDLELGVVADLMFDVSHHLHRLAAERRGRSAGWFDYHHTWRDDRRLEVVIAERYDPPDGEKMTRVITRADDRHEKGKLIGVSDMFVAPETSRFLHEAGSYLILNTAKNWPLGAVGRPIIQKRGDEVDLFSGHVYNHYPELPVVDSRDISVIARLQELVTLLSVLGPTTAEPYVQPGNGLF